MDLLKTGAKRILAAAREGRGGRGAMDSRGAMCQAPRDHQSKPRVASLLQAPAAFVPPPQSRPLSCPPPLLHRKCEGSNIQRLTSSNITSSWLRDDTRMHRDTVYIYTWLAQLNIKTLHPAAPSGPALATPAAKMVARLDHSSFTTHLCAE